MDTGMHDVCLWAFVHFMPIKSVFERQYWLSTCPVSVTEIYLFCYANFLNALKFVFVIETRNETTWIPCPAQTGTYCPNEQRRAFKIYWTILHVQRFIFGHYVLQKERKMKRISTKNTWKHSDLLGFLRCKETHPSWMTSKRIKVVICLTCRKITSSSSIWTFYFAWHVFHAFLSALIVALLKRYV